MLSATCHCRAVRVTIPHAPETATNCNCSICRRYGVLWAYYPLDAVTLEHAPGAVQDYIWGDRELRFVRCATCGCVLAWLPIEPRADDRCGVNIRLFEPEDIGDVRIRRLDGARSWTYLPDDA